MIFTPSICILNLNSYLSHLSTTFPFFLCILNLEFLFVTPFIHFSFFRFLFFDSKSFWSTRKSGETKWNNLSCLILQGYLGDKLRNYFFQIICGNMTFFWEAESYSRDIGHAPYPRTSHGPQYHIPEKQTYTAQNLKLNFAFLLCS